MVMYRQRYKLFFLLRYYADIKFVLFLPKAHVPPRFVIQNVMGVYIQLIRLSGIIFQTFRDPVSLAIRSEWVSNKDKP